MEQIYIYFGSLKKCRYIVNPVIFISTFCLLSQTGFKENPTKKQLLFVFPQGNYLLIRSINIVKQHATGAKVPAPQFSRIKYLSHTLYIPAASLQMFLLCHLQPSVPLNAWLSKPLPVYMKMSCFHFATCIPALRGLLRRLRFCVVHVGKMEGVLISEVWMENNWIIERVSGPEKSTSV